MTLTTLRLRLRFVGSVLLSITAACAPAEAHEAGLALVFPERIVDEPGAGTPPLPAGQDGDGFPDTSETVDLSVMLSNKSGAALTGVFVRLATTDPKVACVTTSVVTFGTVAAGATVGSPSPFRFRVAPTADRAGVVPPVVCASSACSNGAGACTSASECQRGLADPYAARFRAIVFADAFPEGLASNDLDIELDLDASAPAQATSTWTEGFESGLAAMVHQNLDSNIASNALSDGKRCQYHDPDFANSWSYGYGATECYLGFREGQAILNDWHVHQTTHTDGGRAYLGKNSLHWGRHLGVPGFDTYSLSQMDAIRTKSPVRLAARVCAQDPSPNPRSCVSAADCVVVGGGSCVAARSELSFKHQLAFYDYRTERYLERAVLYARVLGSAIWRKLTPFANVYDSNQDWEISSCTFNPDDDGNNEDSYFDPSDPYRTFGPSSTCYPEFAFRRIGDTGQPFAPDRIGRASDGPGLAGSIGPGTWVESKFDLSQFRGRSIDIRWLATSVKFADTPTWEDYYLANPTPVDDGWFFDDVRVTQTLGAVTPTVTLDSADRSFLPPCDAACAVTAGIVATPNPTPAPGSSVVVSAIPASLVVCPDGEALYELWLDGDGDGAIGGPLDHRFGGLWKFAPPSFEAAPSAPTRYFVRARCSTQPACIGDASVLVDVGCPPAETYSPHAWWARLYLLGYLVWVPDVGQTEIQHARGLLSGLRSDGAFGGEECVCEDTLTSCGDVEQPPAGDGFYYLFRGTEPWCGEPSTWRSYHSTENPGDPAKRDREVTCLPLPGAGE